ncbi:MAG TPA: hypothetical protein VFT71_05900 [Candidatus Nitrosocosmicus sp.]|nr:hypothetical protein [Candidatus Nitrosocosmicus sp.]
MERNYNNYTVYSSIEFHYWKVTEFLRRSIEGNEISIIGNKNMDKLDKEYCNGLKEVMRSI